MCVCVFAECAAGHFGEQCEGVCHCASDTDVCHPVSGVCMSGCATGWTGADCQQGTYRRHLNLTKLNQCLSFAGVTLLFLIASVYAVCVMLVACPVGYFGANCVFMCNCRDSSERCDRVTGACQSGCRLGYGADDCQLRKYPTLLNV